MTSVKDLQTPIWSMATKEKVKMKLIIFKEEDLAINIDRIDGISKSTYDSERTCIFVGGSDDPFIIKKPFEEVVTIIYNEITEVGRDG